MADRGGTEMNCITTFTKKPFDPLHAKAEDLDIRDITHALSLLCRANGHFPQFYSVAQHCLNCTREAKARGYSERVQLACLLHDAAEAYMADMPRPVKKALPEYCKNEESLLSLIWQKWLDEPLNSAEHELVFAIDDAVLYHECLHFMNQEVIRPQELQITPMFALQPFDAVENAFLRTFHILTHGSYSGIYIGVDWHKGEWIAAVIHVGELEVKEYDNIDLLCSENNDTDCILVDIPIGLPDTQAEVLLRPDQAARDYLLNTKRKSSVFNTPVRSAVYAATDDEAQNANSSVTVKRLSSQSLAILPIIRQVDTFLQGNPSWKNVLKESHPELAFQALNHGNPVENSKQIPSGISERIYILSKYRSDIEALVRRTKSGMVNDVLDAVCLAVAAEQGSENGFVTVPNVPSADQTRLLMQMVLCNVL